MRQIEFWYDFASTYSYLSAMRVEELGRQAGIAVVWRPFLLGPIFKAQGWSTSPFNVYPAKGRYMVRDIERIAATRGLDFRMPSVFPARSIAAARLALALEADGLIGPFSRAVFAAQFARGEDIADTAMLSRILESMNIVPKQALDRSQTAEQKERLRQQSEKAVAIGLFGAPTFRTPDEEIFWGDDRLEHALIWTQQL